MSVPEKCDTCGKLAFPGETVTISADEYRELLLLRTNGDPLRPLRRPASPIDRDPELAEFIMAASATTMLSDISAACLERFGAERAPSRSAIQRFLSRSRSRAPSRIPGLSHPLPAKRR